MTTKERMLNSIVRKFGFENPYTILFAFACEDEETTEDELAEVYLGLMEYEIGE